MSSREFQPEGTNPVLTGEDVELGSEHFLGDVTSVGEVGKSRRVRRQSVNERQDETSSADDPTAINLDAQNGDENPLENSEAPSDSSSKTDVFEAFMNTPSRTDIAQDADRPTDVLGNRGAAVFSGTNETMVSLPQSDTGVIRRSLAQATQPLPKRTEVPSTSVPSLDEAADQGLLVGATVRPSISSRAGARWLSALSFLLLTPFAWYLLADSGARLFAVDGSPWSTGNYNVAALAEFFGGMAVLLLLGFMATQSSIGLLLSGIVFTIAGLFFLFAPGFMSGFIDTLSDSVLTRFGVVGGNIEFHLVSTGATGILAGVGIAMIMSAWVVYCVRRKGRQEESLRAEVAEVNPEGLNARWARKASR